MGSTKVGDLRVTAEKSLLGRLREWIQSLFGKGPSESELKARVLCSPIDFDFGFAVKTALAPIQVKADDEDFQAQVRLQRDDFLGKVRALYTEAEMHPWFQFLVDKERSISYSQVIDSQELQNKFYKIILSKAQQSFGKLGLLDPKQADAGRRLRKMKHDLAVAMCHDDEAVCDDLQNTGPFVQSKSALSKKYVELLTELRKALGLADHLVKEAPEKMTQFFMTDLDQLLQKSVNPAVAKAVYSSELNKVLGFLNKKSQIWFGRMFDLCYSIRLVPVRGQECLLTTFEFLNMENYPVVEKSVLI